MPMILPTRAQVDTLHSHPPVENQRLQLTLFVQGPAAVQLEALRSRYNPAQYALIAAHVTLCREDELQDLEGILHKLGSLHWEVPLRIHFGKVCRFAEGKGAMLPAAPENRDFHALRMALLGPDARAHEAHITLLHPRNATCTDAIFAALEAADLSRELHFHQIHLITQANGGKWEVVRAFPFAIFGDGHA